MMKLAIVTLCIFAHAPILAQETRSRAPDAPALAADIQELAWLAGEWRGEGIEGAEAVETYSAPVAGQIAGHFVQTNPAGVSFYELLVIAKSGTSLSYRIKHFDPEMRGWEDRDRRVEFPLIARERDAWFFDGLTIRKLGEDRMLGAVKIDGKDGTTRELVFRYRRVR